MTKIILVRHGQTEWNLEMKYQGHSDIALTEQGIYQASLVAERLKSEKVNAVFASDLSRAFQTAEIIGSKFGLSTAAIPAFRELNFGSWEGLTYRKIGEKWQGESRQIFTAPDEVQVPGGETFRQLKDRAMAALNELVEKYKGETIVIVSHGGTIRTILCAALNMPLNNLWSIRQDNTAVNIIEKFHDMWFVSLVNDIHHLNDD